MGQLQRRQLLVGLGATVLAPSPAYAITGDGLHEPTEIAWIIAALTPIGRASGDVIRRDTPYFRKLERWFAGAADAPVVSALGSDFNLPRWVGNAANYNFVGETGSLRQWRDAPLWDDARGDLFTQHVRLVEAFVAAGKAREFLRTATAERVAARRSLLDVVDLAEMQKWLESQFVARPAAVDVHVSPLTGGWNWTNLSQTAPAIWVPAPRPDAVATPVERLLTLASVFTEVDHNYVNPMMAKSGAIVTRVFAFDRGWATPAAREDYATPELVANEYMTWGAFLAFTGDRIDAATHLAVQQRVTRFMVDRRGFSRFGAFVAAMNDARGAVRKPIESCISDLLLACDRLARA